MHREIFKAPRFLPPRLLAANAASVDLAAAVITPTVASPAALDSEKCSIKPRLDHLAILGAGLMMEVHT